MTNEKNNNFVQWTVFVFIISLLLGVATWFANMTNNKLDSLNTKINDIDRRTAFLEGLSEGQKTTFKEEVKGILTRMYESNNTNNK